MPPFSFTQHLAQGLRSGGLRWLAQAITDRIAPPNLPLKPLALSAVVDRVGLEIGGPSRPFGSRGMLPVYRHASRIDNVNFAPHTPWEADLREGGEFRFDRRRAPGRQFIREATDLVGLADASYDFVLSAHCLEHVANPLRALREWHRVTRGGGYLILLLPDPARSFDHRRPLTTLDHLREDFARNTSEADITHMREVLTLHDFARDPRAGSVAEFRSRAARNFENRGLHHHVFDLDLMHAVLAETGWRLVDSTLARPVHLVGLAAKPVD